MIGQLQIGRIVRAWWLPLIVVISVLTPCTAQAGLVGVNVHATLEDTDDSQIIFDGDHVVSDPGAPEFSGSFHNIDWTLDILDNGFHLAAHCTLGAGCNSGTMELTLSNLNFTPPATLNGLTNVDATEPLKSNAGAPVIGSSSITIVFQPIDLGTNAFDTTFDSSYAADFQTTPLATPAPLPSTLLLLALGLPAAGVLAAWRRLS